MSEPELRRALQDAERGLREHGLPAAVDARLRARLVARRAPDRRLLAAGLAFASAGLALILSTVWAPLGPRLAGGLVVARASAELELHQRDAELLEIGAGGCTLEDRRLGARIEVRAPALLSRAPRGLRVERGALLLEVDPRWVRPAPYEVAVSGGRLLVLGTRFALEERGDGGWVELEHGRLRFEGSDGRSAELAPGERLAWPMAPLADEPVAERPETASTAQAPRSTPRPRVGKTPRAEPPEELLRREQQSAGALLERIAALQSRHRYPEAAEALRAALDQSWSAATRERLSFELAVLLSDHLGGGERACAEWARHLLAFGTGRYAQEITAARQRLGCKEAP